MMHKKTGVLAAITPAADRFAALLSIGDSTRRLPDKSNRRAEVTVSQQNMSKTVREPQRGGCDYQHGD